MFVKAQLHIHNNQDIFDTFINYSPYEVINFASALGFKILSFTNHRSFCFDRKIRNYAFEHGILLIPGAEIEIKRKHILVYNCEKSVEKIKSYQELREYKQKTNAFVIAPHPFYVTHFCLGKELEKNKDIFDGIEYSFFHTKNLIKNPNIKAKKFADENDLPLIGTGDVHNLHFFDQTYSLINVDFDFKNMDIDNYDFYIQNIFENIKKNNIKIISTPLNFYKFLRMNIFFAQGTVKKYLKKLLKI